MPERWETILDVKGGPNDTVIESTERLKIQGGWIVRVQTWAGEDCSCDLMAICFVPESAKDRKDD